MRDPIEELKSFNDGPTGGLPVNPLSPADVRRAGDRLRRRRNVGAAVASVAAIAVIATPFALLAGGDDKAEGPAPLVPSETIDAQWLTEIPNGFPIAVGLGTDPEDGSAPTLGEGDEGGPGGITLCGEEVWPVEHLDRAWGELTPPASYLGRDLLLFESDVVAEKAMGNLAARVDQCQSETVFSDRAGSDQLLLHTRYDDGGLGDQTIRFATYWDEGIDTDAYQFVRVGNAIARTHAYGEGKEETVGGEVTRLDKVSADLVSEMQVFSGEAPAEGGDLTSMLLTQAETTMGDPSGEGWWTETGTFPGEGTTDFLPCLASPGERGATSVAMRQFASDGVDPTGEAPPPTWTPGSGLVAMVLEFPDADATTAAYDAFAADLEECGSAMFVDQLDRTSIQGPMGFDVGDAGARVAALTFGPAGQGTEQWLEVGIATNDTRIAIVSSVKRMPTDLDPRLTETSAIELMTVAAAAHLPGVDAGPVTVDENGDPLAGDDYPACAAADMLLTATYDGSGAGHQVYVLELRNEGTGICTVPGRAEASPSSAAAGPVGPTANSPDGPEVVLEPGASAETMLDIANAEFYDEADCRPEPIDNIAIDWPGDGGGSVTFDVTGTACTTGIQVVELNPWAPGA